MAEIVCDALGCLTTRWSDKWIPNEGDKLYTTSPAQRTWVGLTPKEVAEIVIYPMNKTADLVRIIEAKLRSKNEHLHK